MSEQALMTIVMLAAIFIAAADCLRRLRDDPRTPLAAVAVALEAWERASRPSSQVADTLQQVAPSELGGTDG